MKFPKIISFLLAVSLTIFLGGCSITPSSIEQDPVLKMLHDDVAEYVDPFTLHVDPTYQGAAYAELDTNKVYVGPILLREYHSGKYNYNHLLHIIAHECGHLSITGKDKARAMHADSEQFADFFGLLVLDEMQHDGKNVDLYDAINRFLIRGIPLIKGDPHGSDRQRYDALKAKLDYWKKNAGRAPE